MTAKAELFVDSRCELGEGPFWNPLLDRLFWFDILNQTLLSATADGQLVDRITFKDKASAAAVVDTDTLAVAQSGGLVRYQFSTDLTTPIAPIEADAPHNRTNDSRMDRSGGFWIGTMNRGGGGPKTGAVYQWKAGVLTPILQNLGIPNSICFSPDGTRAYFTDAGAVILTAQLDPETGLPIGPWTEFFSGAPGGGDGSVVDSEGFVWNARWGGSCVIRIAPNGKLDRVIELPVPNVSCPAFGGKDFKTLYLTTAREHMSPAELEQYPLSGSVFAIEVDVPGLPEPFLKL
ncbi:SMP-30/gluconolactonase/LRE family protein [Devosia sp.]|jgi:sugar lactone lactonase YvrE|uniref:SMP-30/gluconolactonase/LRE family protein n=1 Tax=Devosia sp. TaxID=1871048 RepID=UPI0037C19C52